MKIGAKLPNSGPLAVDAAIPDMAQALERAGFDSVWVADHIVMPERIAARYPFAADGRPTWPSDTPYVDALIALALAAAVTDSVRLGTAVLVAPLRNPVVLAKQAASIDVASGGRLELGVGAGWLREEFEALNAPFESRGARLEEWLAIARDCWTGRPGGRSSEHYTLPPGVLSMPQPAHHIPVLVGGHSRAALRRAGRLGDGWLAHQSLDAISVDELEGLATAMRAAAAEAGRDPDALRVLLRIIDSAGRSDEVARHLPALSQADVSEIIVDVAWDRHDARQDVERLRAAVPVR